MAVTTDRDTVKAGPSAALPSSWDANSQCPFSVAVVIRAQYWLSLQLRVKHLLHGNEEGIQINMEDTPSHKIVYNLAHRAAKANFSLQQVVEL
jgi:hypothetical protein